MRTEEDLQATVDRASIGVANESLDLSVSEIVNLHKSEDLTIDPEFQRLFRWEDEQQSRLVESLILGLPIPQIFLFQREDGVLELVDGLQRVSSVIRFVEPAALKPTGRKEHQSPLKLVGCDLVPKLNGSAYLELPPSLRRDFLRKSIRAIIIRRTNQPTLRYEMFKRLNSGGSPAEYQEIRNAQIRVLGASGDEFLRFVGMCATNPDFFTATETISDAVAEKQGRQELVMRFFAGKCIRNQFRGNVAEWIDRFTEEVLIKRSLRFNYEEEVNHFNHVFSLIADRLGRFAFVKYRNGNPIGGLAPAYFEAVSLSVSDEPELLERTPSNEAMAAVARAVEGSAFRGVTGPGANSLPKLHLRIRLITEALKNAQDIRRTPE